MTLLYHFWDECLVELLNGRGAGSPLLSGYNNLILLRSVPSNKIFGSFLTFCSSATAEILCRTGLSILCEEAIVEVVAVVAVDEVLVVLSLMLW